MSKLVIESYDYKSVVEIITRINALHYDFSCKLEPDLTCNLRQTIDKVADTTGAKPDFQKLIDLYKAELTQFAAELVKFSTEYSGVRYRVKQSESISEKIRYYLGDQHENGKVPIIKSLNDLLGFRIFVQDVDLIYNKLKNDTNIKVYIDRMYMRDKDGYVGLHIYFKNHNNNFFPWELQIWNVHHAESNENLHKEHKQKRKYILFAKYYYQADLEKEG